eukprot:722330_1
MFQRIICLKRTLLYTLFSAHYFSCKRRHIVLIPTSFYSFFSLSLSLHHHRSHASFSSSQSLFSSCNAATDLLCEIAFIGLRNLLLFSTSFLRDLLLLLLAVDESITPNDLRLLFDSSSGLYLSQGHIRLVYRLTVML